MPTTPLVLTGMHHVSALSAHIAESHRFYTRVLGMRPLIRTVNQDATDMYHLFFGDGAGTPGSDMTLFDMPGAARERRGNNSVTLSSLRVTGEHALEYWAKRLTDHNVPHSGIRPRDNRRVLDFDDNEGIRLCLIDDQGKGQGVPWDASPVPAPHQVRGLAYTTITVPTLAPTHGFLTQALNLHPHHTYASDPGHTTHVYTIGDDPQAGPHAEFHVTINPDLPRARYGAGAVHHVALRVPQGHSPSDWSSRLASMGYHNSGVVDRHYFVSVYVREPNGVLIELATDGPGFDVDGPLDDSRLSLPPFLEPKRAQIEASLQPLT